MLLYELVSLFTMYDLISHFTKDKLLQTKDLTLLPQFYTL